MINNNRTTPSANQGARFYQATEMGSKSDNATVSSNLKKKNGRNGAIRRNFPDFKQDHKNGHPSIVTEWELVCDK